MALTLIGAPIKFKIPAPESSEVKAEDVAVSVILIITEIGLSADEPWSGARGGLIMVRVVEDTRVGTAVPVAAIKLDPVHWLNRLLSLKQ